MEALHHLLFETKPLDDMPVLPEYRIHTYAIVDCAADEQHYQQLLGQDLKHANLYKNTDAKDLETVAPYLIELDPEHDYTLWLLKEHWGTHSVIYIKSHYALETLAEHFRRYTKVVVEPRENDKRNDETLAFFAFYDPRVLKNYFTVLTREQMSEFCEPVICFSYEDEDQPDHLLTSYLNNTGEQWHTQVVAFKYIVEKEKAQKQDSNTETTGSPEDAAQPEFLDDIDIPIIPVIFTIAQQNAFDEIGRQQYCQQLLSELQYHYDVHPNDQDDAIYYLKEAENIGLQSDATQSRYILTALLIKDSPVSISKHLKQSLQIAVNEHSRMQVLDQALEELCGQKEKAYVR